MRGFGFGRLGIYPPLAGRSPVWSDDDLSDWTPINMAIGAYGGNDPETGNALKRAFETAATGNHYINKIALPMTNGRPYRIRLLLKGEGRSMFQFSMPVVSKYWIGTLGNANPAAASGLTGATVTAVGDMYAHTVDLTHTGATGDQSLSILAVIPGPNNNYAGDVSKGLVFGNIKLYDLG